MKEEVRQKVMERFSISEQAMRLLLESAEMMSFVPKDIIVHEGEINTNMYISVSYTHLTLPTKA